MARNGTVFDFVGPERGSSDVLIVPLVSKPQPAMEFAAHVDAVCDDAVSEMLGVQMLRDEAGALAHTTRAGRYRRVLLVSLGEGAKLTASAVRTAGGRAAGWIIGEKLKSADLWVDGFASCSLDRAVAEFAGAMTLAGFRYGEMKEADKSPERVRVRPCGHEAAHVARTRGEIRDALTLADAINYARRIAHQPPNVLNPATLADEARKLAKQSRIKCTVLDAPQLRKLKMNGILSVGESANPGPCLIKLEYMNAPAARAVTVVVGKAVTFDTGGYSIKPAANMEEMKFDKCGGMAVLGILKAAADLKLKCNLVGLIAAAENAISDRAYRPSDIITMMSGKTVEIISTDAEGRMLLGDALWYAQQQYKPSALIDFATLTGGARAALGVAAAALMSTNDDLAALLEECGRVTHERLWRLPLWDDYRDLIKGTDSDIRNSSGKRDAHCIVGGMFLREFVKPETPWAHIDIAAVANSEGGNGPIGKGATGFGIRLMVEYLRRKAAGD